MDWQQVKAEFEWDGSLRDLYVLNTDTEVWQKVIEFIRTSEYPYRFEMDGEESPLPADVAALFEMRAEVGVLLSLDVHGITINCYFFVEDEVEFDIDPREIDGEVKLQALIGFMRRIGRATGRAVRLTPENWQKSIIFEYLPENDEVRYSLLEGGSR